MIPENSCKQIGTVALERVAKVFIVVGNDIRRCLICEKLFSRQASFEHSRTICYPPTLRSNYRRLTDKEPSGSKA